MNWDEAMKAADEGRFSVEAAGVVKAALLAEYMSGECDRYQLDHVVRIVDGWLKRDLEGANGKPLA